MNYFKSLNSRNLSVFTLLLVVALVALSPICSVRAQTSSAGDFRRGDANADENVDLTDPLHTLGFLFLGDTDISCMDAADAGDSGAVDLTDALQNYLSDTSADTDEDGLDDFSELRGPGLDNVLDLWRRGSRDLESSCR